jgi:hypothetical protein
LVTHVYVFKGVKIPFLDFALSYDVVFKRTPSKTDPPGVQFFIVIHAGNGDFLGLYQGGGRFVFPSLIKP